MHDTNQRDDGPRPPLAPSTPTKSRFRGIAAVGVAVVIVALFAALLYSFGPGRTTAGDGGPKATHVPPTATTQRNDSSWSAVAALQQQPAVPIFASGNPAIVYEAAPSVLRRSDDGGKTWHTLTLPSDSSTNPSDVSVLVSPLDAQKVILQVTANPTEGVMRCPTAFSPGHGGNIASSSAAIPLNSSIPQSGVIPCTAQYYSADGGQHWTQLHTPSGVVLGNKNPQMNVLGTPSAPILAQGTSLYTYASCGPECVGPGYRIVRSTDGGATWSYADDALASQGVHVCSFMPAPSGSMIFTLTSTTSCPSDGGTPNRALWSSTDAGAHWSQAPLPAGVRTPQSLFVVSHDSEQPLIYLNLQAPPQPHVGGATSTPTDLHVSTDGGQNWSAAPATGVPTGSVSTLGLVGTLGDGTVVEPFFSSNGGTSAQTLYGLRLGAVWHAIGTPFTAGFVSLTITPTGSGTQDQVWLVTANNAAQNGSIYNVDVLTTSK